MSQSNISAWLQFAFQQVAAESYLDGIDSGNTADLIRRLKFGNNNQSGLRIDPNPDLSPNLRGATRFTDIHAVLLSQRYKVVDHHANDATGFSATLMKDLSDPNDKTSTLSFRSVEYQKQVDGGDWERDGLPGEAGEIAGTGYSLARRVSIGRHVVCATTSVDFIKEGQSTEISASTRHTPPRGGNADRRSSSSRP